MRLWCSECGELIRELPNPGCDWGLPKKCPNCGCEIEGRIRNRKRKFMVEEGEDGNEWERIKNKKKENKRHSV